MDSTRYLPSITVASRARCVSSPSARYTCQFPDCHCLPKKVNGNEGACGTTGSGGGGGGVQDRAPKAIASECRESGGGAGRRCASASTAAGAAAPWFAVPGARLAPLSPLPVPAGNGDRARAALDRVGTTMLASSLGVLSAKNASQLDSNRAANPMNWRIVMVQLHWSAMGRGKASNAALPPMPRRRRHRA